MPAASRAPLALTAALLLLALAAPPAPTASADHAPYPIHLPVLAKGGGAGQGWAAFKVTAQGEWVRATVWGCDYAWNHLVLAYLLDEDLQVIEARSGSGNEHRSGATLTSDAGPVHASAGETAPPPAGTRCSGPGMPARHLNGTYYFVVFAAGDFARWSFELAAGPNAQLLAHTTGTEAFFHASRDFRAPVNAQAWDEHAYSSAGAHAVAAGEVRLTVEGRLFGGFSSLGADTLTASTPEGERACPCDFTRTLAGDLGSIPTEPSWGPGEYVFRATGAGAGGDFMDVRLWGADVRLPE